MHSPPMPASKPPCVATARSWPTAPAGDGRTQCDSMWCSLRQRVTKGAGSRTKGLLMAYKWLDMAQRRWRRLNAAHLLPLVRAGVVFIDGVQQEPNTEEDRKEAA